MAAVLIFMHADGVFLRQVVVCGRFKKPVTCFLGFDLLKFQNHSLEKKKKYKFHSVE